jgi:hypothetical protein
LSFFCIYPFEWKTNTNVFGNRTVIAHDRVEDALIAFKRTAAESSDPDDETAIQAEFNLIVAQINHERENKTSFMELMKRPSMRLRFFLGFITMFGFQSTGTNVINSKPSLNYV